MKALALYLYKIFPFKKEFCFLLKKIHTPGRKIYSKLYFEGVFTVKVEEGKSFKINKYEYLYIEKYLFCTGIYGKWEKTSLKIWSALAKESNYVFDVGANTGVYSLLAKSLNPEAEIFAFEPVERIYKKLKDNVLLNNYGVQTSNKAVSNKNGESVFYDHDIPNPLMAGLSHAHVGENNSQVIAKKVILTTLDSFIQENAIPRVDLVKIDVETFEVEVLEGFSENLKKFKPTMLIEVLNEKVASGISRLLAGMDYDFYNISETEGIKKVNAIGKSSSYNYLICTPEISKKMHFN